MIVQREMLTKLKDFGLNSYEAKLWTALLSRGVSTAGELSDIATVPRSRSYDVLESLEKKGFIIMKLGKPIKYIAVPPSEVIERIKKSVLEIAEQQSRLLEGLRGSDLLSELSSLHKQGIELVDPADLTGAIKGRSNVYNHLYSIIKNAKESVLLWTTEEGLVRKADALYAAFAKAKENGVKVRILAPLTKKSIPVARQLSKYASVRHMEKFSARFLVIDGKQLVLMPVDDASTHSNYDFSVWMNTQFFARSLEGFFDQSWESAKPVEKC